MTNKKQRSRNKFDQSHFTQITKRRFKKKFKKTITAREINKIWKDFVQYGIIDKAVDGQLVKIDKHSTIQVVGRLIEEDQPFMNLLKKGKMLKNGNLVPAELKGRRTGEKYKIVYTNKLAKSNLIFVACPAFKKQVRETLNNTYTYFHIEHVNKQTSIGQ